MTKSPTPQSNGGFTLVEIAIVLAIIGLMIGGVLAGQYTLRQSELQSVVVDFTKYKSAYLSFKSQYGGMPGDIIDATDYWGPDTTNVACPAGSTSPHKETCNGNGNNQIAFGGAEDFRAWQQLSDAGLITGTFSGVAGSGGAYDCTLRVNVPASRISNSGFYMFSQGPFSADSNANWYNMNLSVVVDFGRPTTNNAAYAATLTPREAFNIDTKMDDGKPSGGMMMSLKSTQQANCTTSNVSGSAAYQISYTSVACGLNYFIDQ